MAVNLAVLAVVLLSPLRLYFQPGFPVPVRLDAGAVAKLPLAEGEAGRLRLVMLSPRGEVEATAGLDAGKLQEPLDLAALFPAANPAAPPTGAGAGAAGSAAPGGAAATGGSAAGGSGGAATPKAAGDSTREADRRPHLWDGRAHYLQLAAGETPIGSALAVVPLYMPNARRLREETPNALRIEPERLVAMRTTAGPLLIRLDPEAAPNTVLHFEQLVEGGFYTNILFHRVVPEFVIQGGDPSGTGGGGPGYLLDLEPSPKLHQRGTLSMARASDPNSAGSQFFVCLTRERCAPLDGKYTAFGDVVEGMDVVDKIAAGRVADPQMGRPAEPAVILRTEMVPAPPRPITGAAPAAERRATPAGTTETIELSPKALDALKKRTTPTDSTSPAGD